jgi:hypothetical protein
VDKYKYYQGQTPIDDIFLVSANEGKDKNYKDVLHWSAVD